jgi:hypothetical protein
MALSSSAERNYKLATVVIGGLLQLNINYGCITRFLFKTLMEKLKT